MHDLICDVINYCLRMRYGWDEIDLKYDKIVAESLKQDENKRNFLVVSIRKMVYSGIHTL